MTSHHLFALYGWICLTWARIALFSWLSSGQMSPTDLRMRAIRIWCPKLQPPIYYTQLLSFWLWLTSTKVTYFCLKVWWNIYVSIVIDTNLSRHAYTYSPCLLLIEVSACVLQKNLETYMCTLHILIFSLRQVHEFAVICKCWIRGMQECCTEFTIDQNCKAQVLSTEMPWGNFECWSQPWHVCK